MLFDITGSIESAAAHSAAYAEDGGGAHGGGKSGYRRSGVGAAQRQRGVREERVPDAASR